MGRVTEGLMILNILFYIVETLLNGGNFLSIGTGVLIRLGQVNYLVLHGYWWQLLTSMFVHVNLIHIALNMYFFYILGRQLETLVGGKVVVVTYLLSGLTGNVLSLFLLPPYTISAGASGAIFGIAGALIMIGGLVTGNVQNALVNAFVLFLVNSWMPMVNAFAHLGGLLAGLTIGYLYGRKLRVVIYYEPI